MGHFFPRVAWGDPGFGVIFGVIFDIQYIFFSTFLGEDFLSGLNKLGRGTHIFGESLIGSRKGWCMRLKQGPHQIQLNPDRGQ